VVEAGQRGAPIVVDGRNRGTLPLAGPLRVSVGTHEVQAYKQGLDTLGGAVVVRAKQQAAGRARSLSTIGTPEVTGQHDRALDVVVDGTVVGKTPWEELIAVGKHVIMLRGNGSRDATPDDAPSGARASPGKSMAPRGTIAIGTQPVSVQIHRQRDRGP